MVLEFNIKELNNLVDKEYLKLEKMTEDKLDNLYQQIYNSELFLEKQYNEKFFIIYKIIYNQILKKEKINSLKKIIKKDKNCELILSTCEKNIECIKQLGFTNIKILGEGANGEVFSAKKNGKIYAVKIQKPYDREEEYFIKEKLNEFNIGKKVGDNNLGAKFYNSYFIYNEITNKFINIIVMDKIKGVTLNNYLQNHKLTNEQKKLIEEKMNKLHKLKIFHGDTHKGNIMVIMKKNGIDFIIIDFGFSSMEKNVFKQFKNRNKSFIKYLNKNKYNNLYNKKIFIATNNLLQTNKIEIII